MDKVRLPRTNAVKGRMWATGTLAYCGSFSLFANVRSGTIDMEPIVVSITPPIVAFLTSHLISYFNPRTKWSKAVVYGGFGAICLVAMYASGWHIFEFVTRNGQHWSTAVSYIFMTDAPMLLSAGILITKVTTTRTTAKVATPTIPVKSTPARTNATKTANPPAKKATPRKTTTKPSSLTV